MIEMSIFSALLYSTVLEYYYVLSVLYNWLGYYFVESDGSF